MAFWGWVTLKPYCASYEELTVFLCFCMQRGHIREIVPQISAQKMYFKKIAGLFSSKIGLKKVCQTLHGNTGFVGV